MTPTNTANVYIQTGSASRRAFLLMTPEAGVFSQICKGLFRVICDFLDVRSSSRRNAFACPSSRASVVQSVGQLRGWCVVQLRAVTLGLSTSQADGLVNAVMELCKTCYCSHSCLSVRLRREGQKVQTGGGEKATVFEGIA